MASFAGEGDSNSDENDSNTSLSDCDTDAMLKTETASIVRQFVYDRFEEENEGLDSTGQDEIPVLETARPDALEELRSVREENDPDSTAVRVSRRLREIGDDIQHKYQDEFQDMINQLNLNSANAYKSFAEVARRLFRNGITWHRIVALLCFGYEIAKHVLINGLAGTYMRKIYQMIVDFIVNERIAAWITQNGGWLGFLADFRLSEPSWSTVAAVLGVGILFVMWSMRTGNK
ncbi:bcl-2 homologous antagonist/killer-like [Dendronephthya gigantea]|uniref:bcl-2 homologous antagonist/killer-like n=1 Tax=Dendronephthya gigantea TaxID=151771 RepID=UPI00106A797F|nr:bcl-2 homologous antagonist/killer-like [Dendronephthya gigantea]